MTPTDLVRLVLDAFAVDAEVKPAITLRGGDCLDDHRDPPPYDAGVDSVSDEYLESFHWGVGYHPPRLASLPRPQEEAVTQLLEFLAFTDGSCHQDSACRAIDEWWSPHALYRPARTT